MLWVKEEKVLGEGVGLRAPGAPGTGGAIIVSLP